MKTTLRDLAKQKTKEYISTTSAAIEKAEKDLSYWQSQAEGFKKQNDGKYELAKFMADRFSEKILDLRAKKEKAIIDSAAFFKEIAIDGTGEIGFYFLGVEQEKQIQPDEG